MRYIDDLPSKPPAVLLVSLADKIHNSRAIVADLHIDGEHVWRRFRGGKAGTLWYYRKLCDAFRASSVNRKHRALVDEFDRLVCGMEWLAER